MARSSEEEVGPELKTSDVPFINQAEAATDLTYPQIRLGDRIIS